MLLTMPVKESLTVLIIKNSFVRRTFGTKCHLAVGFNLRRKQGRRFQPADIKSFNLRTKEQERKRRFRRKK
jgi:hypothetical protein